MSYLHEQRYKRWLGEANPDFGNPKLDKQQVPGPPNLA
jgi:hypothetical protein